MDFLGLIAKFPNNRPLNEQERAHHLKQGQRLNVEPRHQLSVIAMNSTYLETVDKWYAWKGIISLLAIVLLLIFPGMASAIALGWLLEAAGVRPSPESSGFLLANGLAMVGVIICCIWGIIWLLRKESFAYTHYPIRFNRKTRMVHVFRPDGSTLSIPWNEVYFTLGHMQQWNEWEVRGHVLDADNTTVRESFALSYLGVLSDMDAEYGRIQFSDQDFVRAHWEFIRRYMEEGPQAVQGQVQFCMPVSLRHETVYVSVERIYANISGANFLLYGLLFPFCLAVSLSRILTVRTSKIPRWPAEVEEASVIEVDDPYAIEGDPSGKRVAVFPGAAHAAGVVSSGARSMAGALAEEVAARISSNQRRGR